MSDDKLERVLTALSRSLESIADCVAPLPGDLVQLRESLHELRNQSNETTLAHTAKLAGIEKAIRELSQHTGVLSDTIREIHDHAIETTDLLGSRTRELEQKVRRLEEKASA